LSLRKKENWRITRRSLARIWTTTALPSMAKSLLGTTNDVTVMPRSWEDVFFVNGKRKHEVNGIFL